MKTKSASFAELTINTNLSYLPIVTSLVEKAAEAMHLGNSEIIALTLSSEEVFHYLCQASSHGQSIAIKCFDRNYYMQVDFEFMADKFNVNAFNLTHSIKLEDEANYKDIGLIIAARIVDRFLMTYTQKQNLCLSLIKEKTYPKPNQWQIILPPMLQKYTISASSPETLKSFSHLLTHFYSPEFYQVNFQFPGKLIDMVDCGEYQIHMASGKKGEILGGIIWRWLSDKTVECFGPYLFGQLQESDMAKDLLDSCLGEISRSTALNAVCNYFTDKFPVNYFEKLGRINYTEKDGSKSEKIVYFRQIKEDFGTSIWSHPDLETFLSHEYQRLVLPREIRLMRYEGELRRHNCVIRANFEKERSKVTLFPLLNGDNVKENLDGYIKLLKKEKILNIFFEMDLGVAWQTEFTPALLKLGFKPCLVLPYAGFSDIVIFQWEDY